MSSLDFVRKKCPQIKIITKQRRLQNWQVCVGYYCCKSTMRLF